MIEPRNAQCWRLRRICSEGSTAVLYGLGAAGRPGSESTANEQWGLPGNLGDPVDSTEQRGAKGSPHPNTPGCSAGRPGRSGANHRTATVVPPVRMQPKRGGMVGRKS